MPAVIFLIVMILASLESVAQKRSIKNTSSKSIERGFKLVPDSVRPSMYWYWMSDNISVEGVKKDVEAMAKIGIGRAFIGNIGYPKEEVPYGNVKLFSDEWWKVMRTAIATATEKKIDIGLFNSPGWSQSGGPWIKPSQSMRYLAGDEINVTGPLLFSKKLIASKPDFQDVAVLAFPATSGKAEDLYNFHPLITSDINFRDPQKLLDGNILNESYNDSIAKPGATDTINIQVNNIFTARSLLLFPGKKPFKADVELQYNSNGTYLTIKKFEYDRTNAANNVGFISYAPVAVSFRAVTSNLYRLLLSNMSGYAGFAEIKLSGAAYIERYEEKQLAKMFQTPLPLWNEYQWPQQVEPENKALLIDPAKIIDLTKNLAADGTLHWKVPEGDWVIIRYGMLPTGVKNGPASPEGIGLEIDKINNAAMQHHFDSFVGKIQQRIPLAERTSLKWLVADSYETGSQNWTDGMLPIFQQQYGYNPLPWLPVLSGRVVGTAEQSNRFLWDLRRLIADRVAYQYVAGLREVSHKNGLKIWLENYGHWGYPSEFLKYGGQSDEISGEFWNEGTLGDIECRAASSAAHIYGKNKVSAESFTAAGLGYARYPAGLKKRGDWSFTEGINNSLLHVFISQPYEDRNPGINAGFGTEFNRKNTWFYQGKAFVDYIRRCNFLLQQGKPVNDVAYFIGEDAPKMTGVRNPELPNGLSYDYINAEVLMERATVQDGKLLLPDGMSYRLLVLPQLETMRPEILEKISALVKEGLTVLGPAPLRSPSLQNYPAADDRLKKMVLDIWGNVDGKKITIGNYGKGNLLTGVSMQQALDMLQIIPDVALKDRYVLYTHRKTTEGDIYFLTNQTDSSISIEPAFRITGKQPEWWDAVDGSTRSLPAFTQTSETIIIPIKLEAYQSGFVFFRNTNDKPVMQNSKENFPIPSIIKKINTPWKVQFDTAMRGPLQPVVFDKLMDWTKSNNDAIKNYSGTAIYKTTCTISSLPSGNTFYLNVGMVNVMAKIKINGKEVGAAWTAPYRVDITEALKKGSNTIEIEVVNTWVNRLIGDSKLPEAERKTWTNVNIYTPDSKPQPSGLIGPVTIEAVKY